MFDRVSGEEAARSRIKSARLWLLGVGALMFIVDVAFIYSGSFDDLGPEARTFGLIVSGVVFVIFATLALFVPKKPRLCLILGLVVFWGIQLFNAIDDPTSLFNGIIVKILFTGALVKGLSAASEAETILADLEKTFE